MSTPSARVTAAEISRLAGVTRATVSNWRRRHPDFPAPTGGTDASPTYDLQAVQAWLTARGQLPADSPTDELRMALRTHPSPASDELLLPLALAAHRLPERDLTALVELPSSQLAQRAQELVTERAAEVPAADQIAYRTEDAPLLSALLRCVQREGAVSAAEVLMERAGEQGIVGGSLQTPAPLADLMADLLAQPGQPYPTSVFDPACGTGGLLIAAARHSTQRLWGQDALAAQAMRAVVRLGLLAPSATCQIRDGDSLRADAFVGQTVDASLCSPPFGNREWGHDDLAYDPRWAYGLPPKIESELAWVQHCLAHLRTGGHAVLLMPPAAGERPSGRRIRAELVRTCALRAVIALPPGAATPFHVGLHLWLLVQPDTDNSSGNKILFVDTAGDAVAGQATGRSPVDWPALHRTIATAWRTFAADPEAFPTEPGTARAVAAVDLLDVAVDLTPARRVRTAPVAAAPAEHAKTADALRDRLHQAVTGLATLVSAQDWPSAGDQARTWRTAAVSDLLRGGAVTLARAPARGRKATTDQVTTDQSANEEILLCAGDVLLPEVVRPTAPIAQVVDESESGRPPRRGLLVLRPDPQRLDPWFLAGFLSAEENLHRAGVGTTIVRLDPRRLRVPLVPLAEQRRYGQAFRHLHTMRRAADLAARLAVETTRALASGLTNGALLPPDTNEQPIT